MPNKWTNPLPSREGPATGNRGPDPKSAPMKTASWPKVPGKTQGRDRNSGAKKIKQSMHDEGI